MPPAPLTNQLRWSARELDETLSAAVYRAAELRAGGSPAALLRHATPEDDRTAANLMGVSGDEWSAFINGGETFAIPRSRDAFDARRGTRAAVAFLDRVLDDAAWPSAGVRREFYPNYVQVNESALRAALRERALTKLGLQPSYFQDPHDPTIRALVLRWGDPSEDPTPVDVRLLRGIARLTAFGDTFLRHQIDTTLLKIRDELLVSIDLLRPELRYGESPVLRRPTGLLDGKMDEGFVDRVMGLDDPRVRQLLARYYDLGDLRVNPRFMTGRIPRSQRQDLLSRGYDAFAAVIEHEFDPDLIFREHLNRYDGQTSALARARLARLRTGFLDVVREDCARRLAPEAKPKGPSDTPKS